MHSFPQSPFLIDGPTGQLEIAIDIPKTASLKPIIGIICHPHPLYSGTMQNKVVTSISWAFNQLDVVAFRFNYRGVGRSEGSYGNFVGEQDDLRCIIDYAKSYFPDHAIWLAGFSFGSFISASVAQTEPLTTHLLSVAPAVNHADFYNLTQVECPWSVIQGEQDDVVPPEEVYAWADAFKDRVNLKKIPLANHFFHGQIVTLRQAVIDEMSIDLK
jgi:alpha/beta superfamily hydrolase